MRFKNNPGACVRSTVQEPLDMAELSLNKCSNKYIDITEED